MLLPTPAQRKRCNNLSAIASCKGGRRLRVGALLHEIAVQGSRRLVNAISLGFQAALHNRGQMVYSFLKVAFDLGDFSLYDRDMFPQVLQPLSDLLKFLRFS